MKKNSTLSDKLNKRLKAYSLTAGAVAAGATGVNAQINYTDVSPDAVISNGDSLLLDVNGDGIDDFEFFVINGYAGAYSSLYVMRGFAGAYNGNGIAGSLTSSYSYPYALSNGDLVEAGDDFNTGTFQTLGWDYFTTSYAGTLATFGNIRWGGGDAYIGLKLDVNGATHLGWARLELDFGTGSIILKDYAYEETACVAIAAGEDTDSEPSTTAPSAQNLAASVSGTAGNGSDITVSFSGDGLQTGVEEYRIMMVKAANAATFNLAAAQAVDMANYTAVSAPVAGTHTETLSASATDVDGDAITGTMSYRAFVMSVADCDNAQVDGVAQASDDVTVEFPAGLGEVNSLGYSLYASGNEIRINAQENINNLTITSVDGRVVANLTNVQGAKSIQVDHASGVYVVTVETAKGTKVEKLFIN
jgi:hypothetical protein